MTVSASTRDILATLIGFDTTSHESNLPLIEWVRAYLAGLGVEAQVFPNKAGDKANLLATLGPVDVPGVMLAGHTDVVPVEDQEWSTDPWTLTERDGRLYGRGTTDMKSWAALALAYAPAFLDGALKMPLHIALTFDEETTCDGAVEFSEVLAALPVRPKVCIVGEPSGMQVVIGQKGSCCYSVTVTGVSAHSSLAPQGVNAVEYACRMIAFLEDLNGVYASEGPRNEGYDVPYSTVTVGTVHGGTALNIVPEKCTFEFSFRNLPEHDPQEVEDRVRRYVADELEPAMKAVSSEASVEISPWPPFKGYELDANSETVQFVRSLSGHNHDVKVSYFTEAGIFADLGRVPSLICGPGFIDQAHKPDEFISLQQLAEGERFMERLLRHVAAG